MPASRDRSARELFAALLAGNYHRGGLKCRRLFRVAPDFLGRLRAEAETLGPELSSERHRDSWTRPYGALRQLSLYNRSGRLDDTSTDYDPEATGKRFHDPDRFPALATLVAALPEPLNVRLNSLGPGAGFSAHEEQIVARIGRRNVLRLRLHLPLATNEEAEVLLDGDVVHFEEGVVHLFNNGCVHSARNGGRTLRHHLVWDMLLSRRVFAFLFDDDAPLPSFLLRLAPAERTVPVRAAPPPVPFPTSRRYPRLYEKLRLRRCGIGADAFRDACTALGWIYHRWIGTPAFHEP